MTRSAPPPDAPDDAPEAPFDARLQPQHAWPSGESPDDPRPTPIRLTNLWRWAHLTLRTDRSNRRRLARTRAGGRGRAPRVFASLFPSVDRPVFLIGAARSGTSFLGDCVGLLPEISYHYEPPATKAAGRSVFDGDWGDRRGRWFYRLVYRWLLRASLDGGLRFSEKTPTNAFLIPFLDRSFHDAQFIHIIRDGRDAAASHLKTPWLRADSLGSKVREPGGYRYGPYAPWWVEPERLAEFESTSDVHRMIWAWRRYVEAARRDGPGLGPGRYLEVRYEALMADPATEGARILDFLGVTAPASRAAFMAGLANAYPNSVGGWRKSLTAADLATIDADSGPLLRQLGYGDGQP